jgi:hypothetical protein
VPGVLSETQSGSNPALQDGTLPLWEFDFSSEPAGPVYWMMLQRGQVLRTALPIVPGQRSLLVGIIEGPPPVPVQNYQLADAGSSQTILTNQSQQQTTTTASFGTTVLFQASTSEGVSAFGDSAKVTEQFDMRSGIKTAVASVQSTTSTMQYACVLETGVDSTTNEPTIQPYGVLVTIGPTWTGYRYQPVDVQGDPIPGAATWTQLFIGSSVPSTATYVIPPDRPQPGQLGTYPAALPSTDTSLITFVDGKGTQADFLPVSWSGAGAAVPTFLSYASQTVTATVTFAFKEMIDEEGSVNLMGASASEKIGVGFEITMELSIATQAAESIGLTASITGLHMDDTQVGTYLLYDVGVYQLAPDATFATQLLSSLVTPDFPTATGDRQMNQDWLDAIATPTSSGASAPWMITYTVVNPVVVQPQ